MFSQAITSSQTVAKKIKKTNESSPVVTEKVFYGHTYYCCSSVFFPPDRIISCSDDTTVRLWDSNTGDCVHTFDGFFDGYINQVIKWTDSSFLVCCNDRMIHLFSILEPFTMIKKFDQSEHYVYRMLKLSSDLFAACNGGNEVLLFPFSNTVSETVVKPILEDIDTEEYLSFDTRMQVSSANKKCFYINVGSGSGMVVLRGNYESGVVEKRYKEHSEGGMTIFSIFMKNGVECLVGIGGNFTWILIYKCYEEKKGSGEKLLMKKFKGNENKVKAEVVSSVMIDSTFLCVGDNKGGVSLIDLEKGLEVVNVAEVHEAKINDLQVFGREKRILSSSADKTLQIFRFEGIKFGFEREEEVKSDLLERMFFLLNEFYSYLFSEDEEKKVLIDVKICGLEDFRIQRSFFLL